MAGGGRIDYEQLTQDAMRSIVRTVLSRTAKAGLPGEHHFYISFDTRARGVVLSNRLKEKYAEEMTIVLQHRFSDLLVSDDRFEVKLTFDNIPERLVVPFLAIKVFFDPSVHFGLQFDTMESVVAAEGEPSGEGTMRPTSATRLAGPAGTKPRLTSTRKPKTSRRSIEHDDSAANERGAAGNDAMAAPGDVEEPVVDRRSASPEPAKQADADQAPDVAAPVTPNSGAEIVRLDQFRKK